MKVLLYHQMPFALAHGGQQIQIVQTAEALREIGVDAELLDWRNDKQRGDVLHFFGRLPRPLLDQARLKRWKVVVADLLGAQGARGHGRLLAEKLARKTIEAIARRACPNALGWTTYKEADACVALTTREAQLLREQFGVPDEKVFVVPNGVEDIFFAQPEGAPVSRDAWLICVATLAPVKRVLETARIAVQAEVPVRFVGKPYSESDPYAAAFSAFAAKHPQWVLFDGPVESRERLAQLLKRARGFVLLSKWESLSLAALEAAASGCPLLLSDLPWARSAFPGSGVTFCPIAVSEHEAARRLREFHSACPALPRPTRPANWLEIAGQLRNVYTKVSANS